MNRPALPVEALRAAVHKQPANKLNKPRQAALAHFESSGFPDIREEDWKYTDLTPLIDISARWLANGASNAAGAMPDVSDNLPLQSVQAHWLIIRNGQLDADSIARCREPGLQVSTLGEQGVSSEFEQPLTSLNTALLSDGLHIRVSAAVESSIGILFIDTTEADVAVSQARIAIEIEEGASANFIEYHVSSGTAEHYANVVSNLTLHRNARAACVRVQDRDRGHSQTTRLTAVLGRDAELTHRAYDLGGKLIRNDLHIDIEAAGSRADFNGLYIAGEGQHIDNHTRVDHRMGPANSAQEYRGILKGHAQCVWNGKAVVHEGADGTDAQQANHNLLLSDDAEIDAKPELEIYAEDVKCSHGTTVGQLDETALFYLRSRGLDKQQAARVLTYAFAARMFADIPQPSLRECIESKVEQRLQDLAGN